MATTSQSSQDSESPFWYFALVFALSLPFWVLGAVVDAELMPGLPLSSLMVVCPALAAVIMHWRKAGGRHALSFLKRAVDIASLRAPIFIAVLVLINPALYIAAYVIQKASGIDIPPPQIDPLPLLGLFFIFLIAATAEELGWTGYALEPLQRRWGMIRAGLIIGIVWAVWHLIPLGHAERSLTWVLWWTLGTVAARILMVWLYNNTGSSVFGISLYHAISNTCWQAYPVQGSYFDPRIDAVLTTALLVVFLWVMPNSIRSAAGSKAKS